MTNLDVPVILQRGVIGLGFLLALLAYWLLQREQARHPVRQPMLSSIKTFLLFSVVLCAMGLAAELVPTILRDLTSRTKTEGELRSELSLASNQLASLRSVEERFKMTCNHLRTSNFLDGNAGARKSLSQWC